MNIERYCPVKSLAGHDKNQYYIVISDEGKSVTMANAARSAFLGGAASPAGSRWSRQNGTS